MWSGHLGKILFSLSEEEGARGVNSTAFSPDGTRLACGCHEGHVLLYDVLSGIDDIDDDDLCLLSNLALFKDVC